MNLILSLSAIFLHLYTSEAIKDGESPFPSFEKLYPLSVSRQGDYDSANANHLNEPNGRRHKRSAPWTNAKISDSLSSSHSGPVMYHSVRDEIQDPVFIRFKRGSIFPSPARASSDSSGNSGRGINKTPLRRAEVPEKYYEDDAIPQQRRLTSPRRMQKQPKFQEPLSTEVDNEKYYGTADDENIHTIQAQEQEDTFPSQVLPVSENLKNKYGGDALEFIQAEKQRHPFRFNPKAQTAINYNNYRHRSRPEIQPGQLPVNFKPQYPSASDVESRPQPGKFSVDRYPYLSESGQRQRPASGKLPANRKHQQRASVDPRLDSVKKMFLK